MLGPRKLYLEPRTVSHKNFGKAKKASIRFTLFKYVAHTTKKEKAVSEPAENASAPTPPERPEGDSSADIKAGTSFLTYMHAS